MHWSWLTENWRDIVTVTGFAATLGGFVYTIYQVRKTRSAASAAKDAASAVLEESRQSFRRYSASYAHRFINEAKIHVHNEDWDKAAMRINDLADHISQMALIEIDWGAIADDLRKWSATCSRLANNELSRFPKSKWIQFYVVLESRIDKFFGPFSEGL